MFDANAARTPPRVALLLSGGGRSALNLHRAFVESRPRATTALILAHNESHAGVALCRNAGLSVTIIPRALPNLDDAIDRALEAAEVELVCLAGYLRKFRVGNRWHNRVLNMHPALLPDFGGAGMFGLHVHAKVLESGRTESGCTVHLVDDEYDHGNIVLAHRVPVLDGDTQESLAARVFAQECIAYPEAVTQWIEKNLQAKDPLCPSPSS